MCIIKFLVFLYLHNKGEFRLKQFRNGLLPLKANAYDNIVNFDIDIQKILSTPEYECETSLSYDKCLETEAISNCSLPFQTQTIQPQICKNFTDGLLAFKSFNRFETSCRYPCYQIKISHKVNPSRLVYSVLNNANVGEEPGYIIQLPAQVKVTEMTEAYTTVSFIAEFGGWSGLFVGISLMALLSKAGQLLLESNYSKLNRKMHYITVALSSIAICYVCYTSIDKLFAKNVGNDISFFDDYSDIRLSICTEDNLYFNNTYLGGDRQFWMDGSNLSLKISSLKLVVKRNGSRIEKIYYVSEEKTRQVDNDIDLMTRDLKINSMNWILKDKVQFCHSLYVGNIPDYLKIFVKQEVFFFIHLKNQFLYLTGKTRLTVMPEQSIIENSEESISLAHTSNNPNFEKYNYIGQDLTNYDSCVLNHLDAHTAGFYSPSKIETNYSGLDHSDIRRVRANIIASQNLCKKPAETLVTNYDSNIMKNRYYNFDKVNQNAPNYIFGKEKKSIMAMYLQMPKIATKVQVSIFLTTY